MARMGSLVSFGLPEIQEKKTQVKMRTYHLCNSLFIQLRTAALRLIVRSGLDVPTFATRSLHARAPSGGRWNCGQEMSGNFT